MHRYTIFPPNSEQNIIYIKSEKSTITILSSISYQPLPGTHGNNIYKNFNTNTTCVLIHLIGIYIFSCITTKKSNINCKSTNKLF